MTQHIDAVQKPIEVIEITPPPTEQIVSRVESFGSESDKRTRYSIPRGLESSSPVGYRHRINLTTEQAQQALSLLSLERPTAFEKEADPVIEQELFEESSLGILSSRQSTNFTGHHQNTLGPEDSKAVSALLKQLQHLDGQPLDHATHTHVIFTRPYRTPFTLLLTFIGHKPILSMATVGVRALQKRFMHKDDIPTIGYLQQLHIGILADAMERAAVIASRGKRQAQVLMQPFSGKYAKQNQDVIRRLEKIAGLDSKMRKQGWRIALVAQTGQIAPEARPDIDDETYERLGANLLSFRSERIQPGVNQEDKAPAPYHKRQDMDVPDELTFMSGRAAYNAFVHWTGCDRELSKNLLLLERIDVLTPNGKERLRQVRQELSDVSDKIIGALPKWVDLPTGKFLSKSAAKGKKAFALAGQRIYIGGLDRKAVEANGFEWNHAVRAFGAAAARSALVAELMGCVNLPESCDLLAGICLMAGPVNQNDIGKSFFKSKDLLTDAFPNNDPTSLLVWTLKAKTIADPIGNEEQLLNPARKGALVDLRPGPHEVIQIKQGQSFKPMRKLGQRTNEERAFGSLNNFITDANGQHIPGNIGTPWPEEHTQAPVWK